MLHDILKLSVYFIFYSNKSFDYKRKDKDSSLDSIKKLSFLLNICNLQFYAFFRRLTF